MKFVVRAVFSITDSKLTVNNHNNSKTETFLKGTFILTIASFIVKVIGSLNWIFVSRILGGEGIGLYQMAFPIYFFAMTVSQAGVPVAISIITAERVALRDIYGAKRVFRISMAIMFFTGLCFSIMTYLAADWLINFQLIRDVRAYKAVVSLAPTIFFVTLLASSRGYLQGWQRMTPTAVSQIVEQIFRVVTMVVLASILMPWGIDYAAAGASLGALAGAIAGLIVLVFFHIRLEKDIKEQYGSRELLEKNDKQEKASAIVKRIFALSLPVSVASIMLPVVSNLDLIIVPQRLEIAGYSINEATELFGYLNGMAVPLVNLATILTASMAISIVPAISKAIALGDQEQVYGQTASSVRISNLVCFPAFVIVFVLATPISSLIYNAPGAGAAVMVSAVSIVLLGLHQVSTGILQGLGHPTIPMINMILAAIAKISLNWHLTALPWLGIMGAAWATVADMGIAVIMNLYFIYRFIGYKLELKQLTKTIVAAGLMAIGTNIIYSILLDYTSSLFVATIAAMISGITIYMLSMIVMRGLLEDDLAKVPMLGSIVVRLLKRIGVF